MKRQAILLAPLFTSLVLACPPVATTPGPDILSGGPETTTSTGSEPATGTGVGTSAAETTSSPVTTTSDPTTTSSSGTSGTSAGAPVCGDAFVNPGEDCDDGNDAADDGCLPDCSFGPGASFAPLAVGLVEGESFLCMTALDAAQIEGDAHALILGGTRGLAGPEGQVVAHVRRVPLPAGDPEAWSYLEYAGIYGRVPHEAETAADGDIIIAGVIRTEDVKVDSGGYLWLARFTPDGALAWSIEDPLLGTIPAGLALTPAGDIVVAGGIGTFSVSALAQKFDGDGVLLWEYAAPTDGTSMSMYRSVTVDPDDGTIYLAGSRHLLDESNAVQVELTALSGAGALLWSAVFPSPPHLRAWPSAIALTTEGTLVVAITETDLDLSVIGLAAFTTGGTPLWWKQWTTPDPARELGSGPLVATDDGGVILGGVDYLWPDFDLHTRMIRFDAQGAPVWTTSVPGRGAVDALLGPDGLLYVLTRDDVRPYLP